MITVLVTGADGQLGQCIQKIAHQFPSIGFLFASKNILDITAYDDVLNYFNRYSIDWCINCAGFTDVDNAENHQDTAYKINSIGARNIARACKMSRAKIVHISTDFVFDGFKKMPYHESDSPNPINIYGESKLSGENEIKKNITEHFIIRTSWLFSEYGDNFLKTMLNLAENQSELRVVNDQIGSPTYAIDLANIVLKIIKLNLKDYGVYHYSSDGIISWFEFANAIFVETKLEILTIPIQSKEYPRIAKRPKYSALDNTKIKELLNVEIVDWRQGLRQALSKLKY